MEEAVAFDGSTLESMKRADLQALCKKTGIKANGKVAEELNLFLSHCQQNTDLIEGLREYAAKHHTQITPAVSVTQLKLEIVAAPASPHSPRVRTPISTRPTEDVETIALVEKKAATLGAQIEQKSATPKAKADTPKVQPKEVAKHEDEEISEPVIAAATVVVVDAAAPVTALERRRFLCASPIAVMAVEPVVEVSAVEDAVAATTELVPIFKWAPFKEEAKSSHDEASDSSQASCASSDSERLSALKSKAKPALTHKVLNKLKSPIKKASRSPIRVAAPKPPVPTAVTKVPAAARATNMPNFDKLHNKAFNRRESLNSFQKRTAAATKPAVPSVATPRPKQAAPITAQSEAKSANVSFVSDVPSTPQQKQRRLSKPSTPFVAQQKDESADEQSDRSETSASTSKISAMPKPTAVVPARVLQTAVAVPKRPVVAAVPSSGAKKPKFDLQASLAKGALPYKAAVSNPTPRVLKDVNASISAPAEKAKRPVDTAASAKPVAADEQRKKMRVSMAVQPTSASAGRRLSTVN